jgi:hypothetical protein
MQEIIHAFLTLSCNIFETKSNSIAVILSRKCDKSASHAGRRFMANFSRDTLKGIDVENTTIMLAKNNDSDITRIITEEIVFPKIFALLLNFFINIIISKAHKRASAIKSGKK